MSATVIPQNTIPNQTNTYPQQFTTPHFQQVYDKWGNQQWDQQQVYNPNYTAESNNQLETLFSNVLRDPRFYRLRVKWSPKLSDEGGVKQKAKNLVDPVHIPYVGAVVAWNRAGKAGKARSKLEKVQEDNQTTNPQYSDVLDTMHNNAKTNQAGLTAKASAKTFFMFFPVVYAIPIGDQMLSKAAEKGATKAATKTVVKGSETAVSDDVKDSAELDANEKWGFSKALLIYLGAPQTNDPIYQTWETSRIQLKQFFGCNPQDDLHLMEPKGEDLKRIEEAESTKGGYDLNTINVPLLVLLWRIYDCWNQQYIDKMTTEKHKKNNETKFRTEDERLVLEMISPIDPHIQRLNESSIKEISRMFREEHPMAYGKHGLFSFLDDKSETKREKRLNWMLKTFVTNLLKSNTGWGYFADSTNTGKQGELLAVLFFERPEQDHIDPSDVLKTFSGMLKLKMDYNHISSRLNWENSVMDHHIGKDEDKYPGIVIYYGCQNTPQAKTALSTLLQSQIRYTSIPTYVQEYSGETERIQFLEATGFKRKNLSAEEQDKHVLKSGDDQSPRLEAFEFFPPARQNNDYLVPPLPNQNTSLSHA